MITLSSQNSNQKWIQVHSKKTQQKLKALSRQSSSKSITEKVKKSYSQVLNLNLENQECFKSNWDFTVGIMEKSLNEINRILINPPVGFQVDCGQLKRLQEKLVEGLEVLEKVREPGLRYNN
jgi:hypothetical protein